MGPELLKVNGLQLSPSLTRIFFLLNQLEQSTVVRPGGWCALFISLH